MSQRNGGARPSGTARIRRSALVAGLLSALTLAAEVGAQDADALRPAGAARATGAPATVSLEDAVTTALANNRELRVARLELRTADKQVAEAYGNLFPEIDADLSYQRNLKVQEAFLPAQIFDPTAPPEELVPVRFGSDNQWSAGVSLTQPLFDAGVFIGVGTASAFRDLQEETVRGSAQRTVTTVRRAYLDVLLAEEERRVTENSIARVEQTLEETRALYRAGLAGEYDVLRLEVQLANLRPNLRRAQNALSDAERAFAVELGLEGGERLRAAGSLHEVDLRTLEENSAANAEILRFAGVPGAEVVPPEALVELAARTRSDLRQARLQRELEEVRVKFERTSLLPRLSAFLNWRITAQEDGSPDFFGENDRQRTTAAELGVRLEVPVFAGLQRWNRVEQRKVGLRQAEVRLSELEQRAENEIRGAAERLLEARERAVAQRAAVGEALRGFEIVTAEYLAGTAGRLEVTDAENALRQSELNYAQAVYDFLAARADLDAAVGVVPVVDPVLADASGADGEGSAG